MQEINNVWEIIEFNDLVHILKNSKKRFITLAIVTEETDENSKDILCNFLKNKSKIYPKVTFLYYLGVDLAFSFIFNLKFKNKNLCI
jgi:hypothetical protein